MKPAQAGAAGFTDQDLRSPRPVMSHLPPATTCLLGHRLLQELWAELVLCLDGHFSDDPHAGVCWLPRRRHKQSGRSAG